MGFKFWFKTTAVWNCT